MVIPLISIIDVIKKIPFKVTLPFAFKPTWAVVAENENDKQRMPLGQKAILDAIKENPFVKNDELAKLIGTSVSSVKNNIQKLKERGLIERIGSKKTGHWETKNK